MSKVVYLLFEPQVMSGGNKVAVRHVEALAALGFDAVVRVVGDGSPPAWFDHAARVEDGRVPLRDDDILVLPEDHLDGLKRCAGLPNRKLVFCQNPYYAAGGIGALSPEAAGAYREFLACSQGVAAWISRYYAYDRITVIPGFADERLFAPGPKERLIACIPRKRPTELKAIRHIFGRLHPEPSAWRWQELKKVREPEVAAALARAAVFLSLNKLEGMGMTTVEAMASDCLVAGFTGLGVREYASSINGLWVEEDDCEAAARALVRACAMAEEDAGCAALMRHAGRVTAQQWSYAAFLRALEDFWAAQPDATRR